MTEDDFRALVLGFEGVVEGSHQRHPDFRYEGRIIASLAAGEKKLGMVKLTPEEQRVYFELLPGVFRPCAGAWGERGYTEIDLAKGTKKVVREVLGLALEGEQRRAKEKKGAGGAKGVSKGVKGSGRGGVRGKKSR